MACGTARASWGASRRQAGSADARAIIQVTHVELEDKLEVTLPVTVRHRPLCPVWRLRVALEALGVTETVDAPLAPEEDAAASIGCRRAFTAFLRLFVFCDRTDTASRLAAVYACGNELAMSL